MTETADQRRKRKLTDLCQKHGIRNVADRAGLNWQSLDQIIKGVKNKPRADGTQTAKNLGNDAAHAIEDAFSLGRGWFDAADGAAAPTPDRLEVILLRTFAKFETDEDKLDALHALNDLLTAKKPDTTGVHNPFGGKAPSPAPYAKNKRVLDALAGPAAKRKSGKP